MLNTDVHGAVWAHQGRCLIANNLAIPALWWSFSFLSQLCRSQFTRSIEDPSRWAAQQALTPYLMLTGHERPLSSLGIFASIERHNNFPIKGTIYWLVQDTKQKHLWILQYITDTHLTQVSESSTEQRGRPLLALAAIIPPQVLAYHTTLMSPNQDYCPPSSPCSFGQTLKPSLLLGYLEGCQHCTTINPIQSVIKLKRRDESRQVRRNYCCSHTTPAIARGFTSQG